MPASKIARADDPAKDHVSSGESAGTVANTAQTHADFWAHCISLFGKELPKQQFDTWIKPLSVRDRAAINLLVDCVELIAPTRFVQQWIKDRYLQRLESLALEFWGTAVRVTVSYTPAFRKAATGVETPSAVTSPSASAHTRDHAVPGHATSFEKTRLNRDHSFDAFVTGKANQLARAAAIQVAENPGTSYNPLFLYGGVGLGKTHLVQAIGNQLFLAKPDARIRYIHAEQYVTDVVRAYQKKAFDEFKRYYHSLDLLIIDDIQFFNGKNRTQEEFFYAFNALIEAHKQVIITCDRFPKELADVEDRLVSRFGWGLTVAIEPPELEMRVAILINKAAADDVVLDESIAFFIAKHIRSNVRELEGALKRVFAYVRFTSTPLSLAATKEALKDLLVIQNRQVSIENIQKTVADYYKIKVAEMYSKKRNRAIARPRQVAMALAKEFTQLSLPDIGEAFGGRDHTTVLHACRKIEELKESDGGINRDLIMLQQILKG